MRRAVLLVGIALLAGLAARLFDLDAATMGHNEMYVPRIPLPGWVTFPHQLMSFRDVAVFEDIHPPGFQMVWFPWLVIAGTSLTAIRLPAVVFGLLLVPAGFVYAKRFAGLPAAVVVAVALALDGNLVFWSQQGRHWTLMALCVVVSTTLLARLEDRWSGARAVAFALVTCVGMWSEYAYWPIVAGQMLWAAMRNAPRRLVPSSGAAFALAMVLSSPVLFYLRRSLGRPDFLPRQTGRRLLELLQFGQVVDLTHGGTVHLPGAGIAGIALGAAGLGALLLGSRPGASATPVPEPDAASPRPAWLAALAIGALAVDAYMYAYFGDIPSQRLLKATMLLPWVWIALWILARALWVPACALVPAAVRRLGALVAGEPTVVVAFAPVLALTAIELAGKTVLAQRNLLMVVPLVLILMVRGVMAVRQVPLRRAVLALLLVVAVAGAVEGATRPRLVRDYQGLAGRLRAEARPGDLIVIHNEWYATPLHYYLRAPDFRLVPPEGLPPLLPARVWVVEFGDAARVDGAIAETAARWLPGRIRFTRLRVFKAGADLYAPPVTP